MGRRDDFPDDGDAKAASPRETVVGIGERSSAASACCPAAIGWPAKVEAEGSPVLGIAFKALVRVEGRSCPGPADNGDRLAED